MGARETETQREPDASSQPAGLIIMNHSGPGLKDEEEEESDPPVGIGMGGTCMYVSIRGGRCVRGWYYRYCVTVLHCVDMQVDVQCVMYISSAAEQLSD
jgi:hypothetical protein